MSKNINSKNLHEIWNQVPVDYYQRGVEKNLLQKIWHTLKIIQAKRILKNKNFKNCLDIGCASGFMTYEIYKTFPQAKYFGIDIYNKAITHAKKKYPQINFKVASAQDLPYNDNSFELVLFYETIEHVEDPFKALKEIRRVLKKDGTVILTMDSGSWLFRLVWMIWEKTSGKVWQGAHLHPFDHNELESLIRKAKFKIKQKIFSHLGMEVTFVLTLA